MEDAAYLKDSYLKEFEAEIVSVKDDKFVVLNDTIFYPNSGGQPYDTGVMIKEGEEFNVVFVGKFSGSISHEVDKPGLAAGDKVTCKIDWDRRYKLMRCHTAAHIVSEVIHKATKALITGNQLDLEKCRVDFALEDFNPDKMREYISEANAVLAKDLPISVSFKSREEAMQMPQVSKLAKGLPESLKTVRIVDIGGYDVQGDGGTHVHSTKEVGTIEFIKCENKGKNNRRLYWKLI